MSRGAGWVERAILDALTGKAVLDTFQVAAEVFDCRPVAVSAAQLASVRRALLNLEKQGKVFGGRAFGRRRRLWSRHPARAGALPPQNRPINPRSTPRSW